MIIPIIINIIISVKLNLLHNPIKNINNIINK